MLPSQKESSKALELSLKGGWKKNLEEALTLLDCVENESLENVFNKAEELSRRENLKELIDLF